MEIHIYNQYALKTWVQSQGYLVSSSYLQLSGGTMTGLINFNNTMTLSTTYTGCRISLWYDGTYWYGLGMNASQLIYNASIGASHVFQINESLVVKINSSGLYIGSNLLSSTIEGYLNTCTSNIQTQINNKIDVTGGTISSGNLRLTSGSLILGTYSLTQTILNSLITNYSSYATQTWVYNQGYITSVDVAIF